MLNKGGFSYNLLQFHVRMKHSAYKVDSLYSSALAKRVDLFGVKTLQYADK